jgi:HEAT repeat protein
MNRGSSSRDRTPWFDGELDVAMVPLLLEKADYREKGIPEGKRATVKRVPYAAVDMLAALRKDGLAPKLDIVAEDPKQNSVTRLTCVLAMYAAGEKLDTLSLLSILKTDNRMEPRLNAIIALRHTSDAKAVTPVLLELLDDRNEEIQLAAVYALRGAKPPKAVDKLKIMLDQAESAYAHSAILDLLGEIGTKESAQALADFMASALKDESKSRHLSQALRSFQDATGQRWTSAGAHKKDYYQEKAREALAWWKKARRR